MLMAFNPLLALASAFPTKNSAFSFLSADMDAKGVIHRRVTAVKQPATSNGWPKCRKRERERDR